MTAMTGDKGGIKKDPYGLNRVAEYLGSHRVKRPIQFIQSPETLIQLKNLFKPCNNYNLLENKTFHIKLSEGNPTGWLTDIQNILPKVFSK